MVYRYQVVFLNKKQLMVAIPIWIVLGAFIYFVPVQNMIQLQEHKYDCKTDVMFLQLENGTRIPCHNHSLDNLTLNTTFNSTLP